MKPDRDIAALLAIMAALRTPGSGCPWDLAQDFASIAPYTIEEAYEVADAIARGDLVDLKDELGDLLLQVVFHARMAEEQGAFAFGDVVQAIGDKMVRRHPHVFGDENARSPADVNGLWARIKAAEKAERQRRRGEAPAVESALAGIPAGLPPLRRSHELQVKAATVGFDWGSPEPVLAKIHEEADEVAAAALDGSQAQVAAEIGDLLFAVVNLARHHGVDPDIALGLTNAKFERRFAGIEAALAADGRRPADSSLAEMDALWEATKLREKATE